MMIQQRRVEWSPKETKVVIRGILSDKLIYAVKNNTYEYIVINTQLAICFGYSGPSSGQYLIYGHGAFSECVHYGIPYCQQTIFILELKLKSTGRCIFEMYVKTSIRTLVNPYQNLS